MDSLMSSDTSGKFSRHVHVWNHAFVTVFRHRFFLTFYFISLYRTTTITPGAIPSRASGAKHDDFSRLRLTQRAADCRSGSIELANIFALIKYIQPAVFTRCLVVCFGAIASGLCNPPPPENVLRQKTSRIFISRLFLNTTKKIFSLCLDNKTSFRRSNVFSLYTR